MSRTFSEPLLTSRRAYSESASSSELEEEEEEEEETGDDALWFPGSTHRAKTAGEKQTFDDHTNRHLWRRLAPRSNPSTILQNIRRGRGGEGRVIALDIDRCSALGEDTNDYLRIVGYLTDNYAKNSANVVHLASLLINPEMVHAVNRIRDNIPNALFVFYTNKSRIVTDLLKWKPRMQQAFAERFFIHNDVVKFEHGNLLQKWTYAFDQLKKQEGSIPAQALDALKPALYRLALITWAASVRLFLEYSPAIYVSKGPKNLRILADDLRLHNGIEQLFLFDDKSFSHATALNSTCEEEHMIPVPPFGNPSLSRMHSLELKRLLDEHFAFNKDFAARHLSLPREAGKATPHWPADRLAVDLSAFKMSNLSPATGHPRSEPIPSIQWKSHQHIAESIPNNSWDVQPALGRYAPSHSAYYHFPRTTHPLLRPPSSSRLFDDTDGEPDDEQEADHHHTGSARSLSERSAVVWNTLRDSRKSH